MKETVLISFAFSILLALINAQVTVLKSVTVIYDKSPKLRIRGQGFTVDASDIKLSISSPGGELRPDKDYLVTKDADGDGLILKTLGNKKWVDLSDRNAPVSLILNSVSFGSDTTNLIDEPVIIAQVLNTPSIDENLDYTVYQTASNVLRINGTGFVGAKKVDLYFQPPLTKEVAYEDVSKYPLRKNSIELRLRHGYEWRASGDGPLAVVGVDTGGGAVRLNGDDGVEVAYVTGNLDQHKVAIETENKRLYADEADLTIKGTGFNTIGNILRWSNGLLGNNVNYTTVSTSATEISIRLKEGSSWRKNPENLPGALTLLAVDAGEGFVAVGPLNSGKGKDVAMVFERPQVFSDSKKIFRTHSHVIHIKGLGFPTSIADVKLTFSPPLVENTDYIVRVVDRTELEVTLLDSRAWRSDAGNLAVTAINVRGDDAGLVALGGGVVVAEVIADIDGSATGGVEVFPVGTMIYQTKLQETLAITGIGFKEGMEFTFSPSLKKADYTLSVESAHRALVTMKSGKAWRTAAGDLLVQSVKVSGQDYPLAGGEGIRVAKVLADPQVFSSLSNYHESQSKLIAIYGEGFTRAEDIKITIRPSSPGSYMIRGVLSDTLRVQLKQDKDWLPPFMSLRDEEEGKSVLLQLSSIDTGAGDIIFPEPITIGNIIKDREGVTCDDSCEFAFDGVCDDGTEHEHYYSYYMDDDFGGFYDDMWFDDGDDVRRRVEETEENGRELSDTYDYGYGIGGYYDDYYGSSVVSACVGGTDCTDCGGVDAIIDYSNAEATGSHEIVSCSNDCMYARDGVCDDTRGTFYCELGTDCQDCGLVGADNFTRIDDDGWWDDDDDYWIFNDGNFLDQTKGLEANRDKVRVHSSSSQSSGSMFLIVLEGMGYTIAAICLAGALFLLNRWYKGQSIPFVNAFNPDAAPHSFELAPTKKMPITPDVLRT